MAGGRFSDIFIQDVREASDIVDVIGETVALKKAGRNHLGLCPFHHERTPSFTVTPDKQMFYCFGCSAGGNVITFIMMKEGLPFGEAVERLAGRAGLPLPEKDLSPEAIQRRREMDGVMEALELACAFYERALREGEGAAHVRAYLEARGLDQATLDRFRIGWAPAGWDNVAGLLQRRGMTAAFGERASLLVRRQEEPAGHFDRFRERVMFPIFDGRGRVIAFGGRVLDDSLPKYLNSGETEVFVKRRTLYPLHLAREGIQRAGQAVLVEGYLDAITAHRLGHTNVVASLGTALSQDHCRVLLRLAPKVVIAYDADAAGTAATLRGLDLLSQLGGEVLVATMPAGMDPDDFLRREGPAAFGACLGSGVALIEYKFRQVLAAHPPSTIEGRVKATAAIAPILATLDNAVALEAYVNDFAPRLGATPAALRAEVERARASKGRPTPVTQAPSPAETRHRNTTGRNNTLEKHGNLERAEKAEAELIRAMITNEKTRAKVLRKLGPAGFSDETHGEIAAAVERAGAQVSGRVDPQRVLDFLEDAGAVCRAVEIMREEGPFFDTENDNMDKYLDGLVGAVMDGHRERDYQRVLATITDCEVRGLPVDPKYVEELRRLEEIRRSTELRATRNSPGR
jgi:DNA primase